MNDFNWSNFIGEHMSTPLMVVFSFVDDEKQIGKLTGLNMDYLILSAGSLEDIQQYSKICKPIIKSISDLTDEELCFIVGFNSHVRRQGDFIRFRKDDKKALINIKECWVQPCDQQILNRLYSLHCHPNAEELIKNGLAVRKA